MRGLVAAGLAGIAVLLGASLLLLDRIYREGPAGSRAVAAPTVAPPAAAAAPEAYVAAPPVMPPGFDQAAKAAGLGGSDAAAYDRMAQKEPPRPRPPAESWEAVPIATGRTGGRDGVAAVVVRELNDLHDELVECFDPTVAARLGGATPTRVKEEVQDEAGNTLLILQLELQAGKVRIVDAPVALSGGASEATLACAQARLRGKVFDAPGAKPGGRRRMQFALNP